MLLAQTVVALFFILLTLVPQVTTVTAATAAAPVATGAAPQKMNVLFLAADDMRIQLGADRVPGTPDMSTPHLDALIDRSLFLRKAQCQQAVCSPTRTSLLTSRYPDTTRVWDLYSWFRDVGGNYTTIPELFRTHGYETHGCGKIYHPGHASGAGSGVPGASSAGDDYPYSWSTPHYFHAPNLAYWSSKTKQPGCDGCGNSWISVSPEAEQSKPLPGTQIADHAVQKLANFSKNGVGRAGGKPFFLAVGFHKPHLPFVAPERFFQSYGLRHSASTACFKRRFRPRLRTHGPSFPH